MMYLFIFSTRRDERIHSVCVFVCVCIEYKPIDLIFPISRLQQTKDLMIKSVLDAVTDFKLKMTLILFIYLDKKRQKSKK